MSNQGSDGHSDVPTILAIDTATRAGSIAVARGEKALASIRGNPASSHSVDLIDNIDRTLEQALVQLCEIDLFAASVGPGSFTGLRIGLATVKSLSVSLQRKCVGVSTLAAIAQAAGVSKLTVALLPAGRGEVFAQMFAVGEDSIEPLDEPAHISPPAAVAKYLKYRPLRWTGEGADAQLEFLRTEAEIRRIKFNGGLAGSDGGWIVAAPQQHLACAVAKLANREWRKGNIIAPEELRANYVRPSDAEIKSHA